MTGHSGISVEDYEDHMPLAWTALPDSTPCKAMTAYGYSLTLQPRRVLDGNSFKTGHSIAKLYL